MKLEGGYYPGEFPLQAAIIAGTMKVFGVNMVVARGVNLIFGILCAFLLYGIAVKLFPDHPLAGYVAVTLFSVHSLFGFLITAIMPEILCALLSLLSLYVYLTFKSHFLRIFLTCISLSLAVLVKPAGFLVVAAILFLYRDLKAKIIFEMLMYLIVPTLVLKLWLGHTMQFEHYPYGNTYSLTHHYARTIDHFLTEFTWSMVGAALEKSILHGLNVAGVAVLIFMIYNHKRISSCIKENTYLQLFLRFRLELGLVAWTLANFAFLLYAGNIQTEQTYYAMPLCVPLLILSAKYISLFSYRWIMLVVFLQLVWKWGYLQLAYIKYVENWSNVRLEQYTDRLSTRSDLFLVYNNNYADFTLLGRVGRRGINVCNAHDIEVLKTGFKYLYIEQKDMNSEVSKVLTNCKQYKFGTHLFYDLKVSR
jgi:4-amino-4-deoxy-L-arabinose transferase-like glycosyltransferase